MVPGNHHKIMLHFHGKSFFRLHDSLFVSVDGFLFLLIGTALYNELVVVPCIPCLRKPDQIVEVDADKSHHGNIQYGSDSDDDVTQPLIQDKNYST